MQFSLFGAEAGELVLADLDGVLLGGGQWLEAADGARLSAVVVDRWRADALADAFGALGVGDPPSTGPSTHSSSDPSSDPSTGPSTAGGGAPVGETGTGAFVARTAVTPSLRPVAARWRRGAATAPPDDLVLSAGGLRLWAVTSGSADEVGYVLRTPQVPDAAGPAGRLHRVAGALLARTGIAAVELGARGGPGWRITSARRLRRLAELVGPPPPGAEADWPALAAR